MAFLRFNARAKTCGMANRMFRFKVRWTTPMEQSVPELLEVPMKEAVQLAYGFLNRIGSFTMAIDGKNPQ